MQYDFDKFFMSGNFYLLFWKHNQGGRGFGAGIYEGEGNSDSIARVKKLCLMEHRMEDESPVSNILPFVNQQSPKLDFDL